MRIKQFVPDALAPEVTAENLVQTCWPVKSWKHELRTFLWAYRKVLKIAVFINPFGPVLDRLGRCVHNDLWFSRPTLIRKLEGLFYENALVEGFDDDVQAYAQIARHRITCEREIQAVAVKQLEELRLMRIKERMRQHEEQERQNNSY